MYLMKNKWKVVSIEETGNKRDGILYRNDN